MKYKAFFIIFKEISIKEITQFFLEGESPTLNHRSFLATVNKKDVSASGDLIPM